MDRAKSFWHLATILVAILAHATDFRVLPIANFIVAEIRLLHQQNNAIMNNEKEWLIIHDKSLNMTHIYDTRAYAVPSAATNITSITSAIWLLVNHCSSTVFHLEKTFLRVKKSEIVLAHLLTFCQYTKRCSVYNICFILLKSTVSSGKPWGHLGTIVFEMIVSQEQPLLWRIIGWMSFDKPYLINVVLKFTLTSWKLD